MRRMYLMLIAGALLVGIAIVGLLTNNGDGPPKTVKALRYRIVQVESALELSHGGGRWADELFLPEAQVAGTLVFDTEYALDTHEARSRVRLFAFHATKPRNHLTGIGTEPSAIEEIEIPADLAEAIIGLSKLTEQWKAETERMGERSVADLGWKERPRHAGRPGSTLDTGDQKK